MPAYAPPERPGKLFPRRMTLPAGSELWRCHGTSLPPNGFNPHRADSHFGGGRFDGTAEDPYPFLYAGETPVSALAETLLRGLEFSNGTRLIPRVRADRRSLSRLWTTEPLELISLVTEEDLAAAGQDSWLVSADGRADYPQTRRWARALRGSAPWAQGMAWQSLRCRPHLAFVLFGDRCGKETLTVRPALSHNLGTTVGRAVANRLLVGLKGVIWPGDTETA